jgi:ankyrin repeat protein
MKKLTMKHGMLTVALTLAVQLVSAQDGNELQMLDLAAKGDTVAAMALIGTRTDVNQSQSDGTTALHWAVYYNDAALVDMLIARGADIGARNDYGATPLSQAALTGNPDIIEALLSAGADVDERGADDQTALMILSRTSNTAAVAMLLDAGADVNAVEKWRGQTALMWAVAQKQPEVVSLLLSHGAEVNARSLPNNWERQVTAEPRMKVLPAGGLTPLLYAAREGCTACTQRLIDAGADLDMADPDGVTPLLMANLNAHWDSAKLLIEAGAHLDKWDIWGRSPLYSAVDYSTLPHGGRADRLSADLTTPLEIIELLLQQGANPNLQLKLFPPYRALGPDRGADQLLRTGSTALFRAARGGDLPAVDLLLRYGANIELPNENGVTPLIVAAGYRQSAIDTRGRFRDEQQAYAVTERLLAAGADVNATEEFGQTAIFGAATNGWNSIVQLLADQGADLRHQDNGGSTVLDAAMGRAGRFGRGSGGDQHLETAALIESLLAAQ